MSIAKSAPSVNIIPFVALFLGCAGLWVGGSNFYGILRSTRASAWNKGSGKIVVSHLVPIAVSGPKGGVHGKMRAEIHYQYNVGKTSYESDVLNYFNGQIGGSRHYYAAKMIDSYSVGDNVIVSYNPVDPSDAVIDARIPQSAIIGLIVGISLFVGYVFYVIKLNISRRALRR